IVRSLLDAETSISFKRLPYQALARRPVEPPSLARVGGGVRATPPLINNCQNHVLAVRPVLGMRKPLLYRLLGPWIVPWPRCYCFIPSSASPQSHEDDFAFF